MGNYEYVKIFVKLNNVTTKKLFLFWLFIDTMLDAITWYTFMDGFFGITKSKFINHIVGTQLSPMTRDLCIHCHAIWFV